MKRPLNLAIGESVWADAGSTICRLARIRSTASLRINVRTLQPIAVPAESFHPDAEFGRDRAEVVEG